MVGGAPATNPSRLVAPEEALAVSAPPPRFVSRGGEKLFAALERFAVDLRGARVLDAGASTGGFTDCALQAGAASVVAVDVGRGQLHQRLLVDPRVEVHERTNVRHLAAGDLGPPADAVVADLSFISLRTVVDALLALARPGADLVWLVKPQFEASRAVVSRTGGIVTDPAVWHEVLRSVGATIEERGATIMGVMPSPLRGADGNVEFLLHAVTPGEPPGSAAPTALVALVDSAVAEVER